MTFCLWKIAAPYNEPDENATLIICPSYLWGSEQTHKCFRMLQSHVERRFPANEKDKLQENPSKTDKKNLEILTGWPCA